MEIDGITLILIGLCSGIGNAAGNWFFQNYLKHHAEKAIEKVKNVKEEGITIGFKE